HIRRETQPRACVSAWRQRESAAVNTVVKRMYAVGRDPQLNSLDREGAADRDDRARPPQRVSDLAAAQRISSLDIQVTAMHFHRIGQRQPSRQARGGGAIGVGPASKYAIVPRGPQAPAVLDHQ